MNSKRLHDCAKCGSDGKLSGFSSATSETARNFERITGHKLKEDLKLCLVCSIELENHMTEHLMRFIEEKFTHK